MTFLASPTFGNFWEKSNYSEDASLLLTFSGDCGNMNYIIQT